MTTRPPLDGICRITDWGVIRARGADAGKFLQGQLTNDVLTLGSGRARLAGFCSAKGRLQASFVVWQAAPDELLLACSASLLAPTLKRLSMFVLRAQCKLSDASAEIDLWGMAGESATARLGDTAVWQRADRDGVAAIRLPDASGEPRALLAAPAGASFDVATAPLAVEAWNWLAVQSGVVTIEAATVDRFVPQMVNFERVGGVDFQKGCYPGQEVVARSQYRGTTKRRAFVFDADAVPAVTQDVFADGLPGEPVGVVANAAPNPDRAGGNALVELRLAALDAGPLRLGAPDGPVLRPVPMPYELPLEAEAAG